MIDRGAVVVPPAVRGLVLLAVVTVGAGCIHYPTVDEVGSTRIRPENARAVRQPDGAAVYVDLHSTGKFGDAIVSATTPLAREARLVDATGAVVQRVEVPGLGVPPLRPGAPHVRIAGLKRALHRGEAIIVTLVLEKTGQLGLIAVVE